MKREMENELHAHEIYVMEKWIKTYNLEVRVQL